jgi:hypothetical protein
MHRQGLTIASQKHGVEGTIPRHCRGAAMPRAFGKLGYVIIGLPQGQVPVTLSIRLWLACKNGVEIAFDPRRIKGLLAVEIIAE